MKRNRGFLFAAAVIGALCGLVGCATVAPKPPEVESVGTLTESATHVAQAPVHATSGMEDGTWATPVKIKPAPAIATAPAADETPDIAPKSAHGF